MNKINYDKHDWIDGEPITETLFNNIESGVGRATSSTNLLVDRTNQEEESLSIIEGKIEHQDMEFDIAIGEHDTLDERLKADVSRFVEVWSGGNYMSFEGKNIRIDNSKVGWIRDFKMSGETYQDPNNLSNIQSAGELVDGKYKIEILSHGKNLFDMNRFPNEIENGITEFKNDFNGTITGKFINQYNTTYSILIGVKEKQRVIISAIAKGCRLIMDNTYKTDGTYWGMIDCTNWKEGEETIIYRDLIIDNNSTIRIETPYTDNSKGFYIKNICVEPYANGERHYEPYKENKTQILLDEPLMRLTDGTCDTIEQREDGVYLVQRIEKVAYAEGDENLDNCITDKTISYKAKATPVETKLDLDMSKWLTYKDITYFTTTCNVQPTLSLKAPVDTQAIVSNLQATNFSLRRNNQQLEQENQQAEKELNTLQEQCDQQTADLLDMDMRVLMLEE